MHERYVREWLSGQAASGYIDYHADKNAFSLSAEQAIVFAEEGSPAFFGGAFDIVQSTYLDEPKVAEAFRTGKGVGWHEHSKCLMVRLFSALGLSTAIVIGCGARLLYAQNTNDPNAAPNPYRMEELRVQLPDGRKLGAPIGVEIDQSDGKTLWVYKRCGADTCVGSTVDPVMKLDGNGKILTNFGGRSGQSAARFLCRSSR